MTELSSEELGAGMRRVIAWSDSSYKQWKGINPNHWRESFRYSLASALADVRAPGWADWKPWEYMCANCRRPQVVCPGCGPGARDTAVVRMIYSMGRFCGC